MEFCWKPDVKKHILAHVNGNWEAVVPVTNVIVHSLFRLKLPGIFYEMDSFCICCYQLVFFLFFFFVPFFS